MKATPAELRPNFDRWLGSRLAGLCDERRQKVVEKRIEQAPDILWRALQESGAFSEIKKLETQKAGEG